MHENNMFRRSGFPVRWWRFPTTVKLSMRVLMLSNCVLVMFLEYDKDLRTKRLEIGVVAIRGSVDEDEEKVLESRRRKIQNDGYVQDARSSFCNDQYEAWHLVVRMDMEMDPYGMA
ncbi:unnamed protein product [Vicia faba]|uniref:Uncharacterized protein n=1 Tax=Vicia faba TaxID=3906 RepID=A0AAV1APC1_VICFA|nr:unnamed protein product [Vicia faba]